ncbi:MAG: glycosyltransferase family 2 protein [Candidatus Thermoplasmatota archaeon]
MEKKVGIVIPNWNGKKDTIECINSLKKMEYKNYKILVIDNCSSNGSVAYIKEKHPDVSLTELRENIGFGCGCNLGISHLINEGIEYFLILNNDIIATPTFLTKLINAMDNDKVGIAMPIIYGYDDKVQHCGGRINFFGKLMPYSYTEKKDLIETELIAGACCLIKKEVIEKIGMIDPIYFAYCEDTDFGLRARKKGYKAVVVPDAKIWHKGSATGGKISGFISYYGTRNRIILMKKHFSFFRFLAFSLIYTTYKMFIALSCSIKKNEEAKKIFSGLIDGFRIALFQLK